jgi:hypothetical protein
MKRQRLFSIALPLGVLLVLATGTASLSVGASDPVGPRASLDDGGYDGLVIGVPHEDLDSILAAGGVNVLYSSAVDGLTSIDDQFWHQDVSDVLETAEEGDKFGYVLASGDFDGNGLADLAIGVPKEALGTTTDGGAVHVLYGARGGLADSGNQLWTQDSNGIQGAAELNDSFGRALAAGDFDGDGYDDLVIGVPYEDLGSNQDAGAVNVIYGSASGLTAGGNQLWHQDSDGIEGEAEFSDFFGSSLATGDFDGDCYADLAIGVRWESIGSAVFAGAANIIYGSSGGLTELGDQWFHQKTPGVEDTSESYDEFGHTLAAGDFDGDGYDDLAIGVPGEDYGGKNSVGAVNVVYGSSSGLSALGDQFWHQDVTGTQDTAEESDHFGQTLTTGDFDGDGYDDLAVGVPDENNGSIANSGAAHAFYGADGGLTTVGDWFFHQDTPGIEDVSELGDHFGYALTAGDFDGDGYDDLAVGAPEEDVGTIVHAGAANLVYGSGEGLTADGNQLWHQDIAGVLDDVEHGDRFGYALAALPLRSYSVYLPLVVTGD